VGTEKQTKLHSALYSTFAHFLFIIGLCGLMMGTFVGKAEAFRFLFGSQNWTIFSHMSTGLYYTVPMVSLFYFMSTQHQIAVTYYMFIYYFAGNFLFGI